MVGVIVMVDVLDGVAVNVWVAVGAGVLVGNNTGMPAQDWIRIANTATR
jgi:hypothetical protein